MNVTTLRRILEVRPLTFLLLSIVCAGSVWIYASRVLIPQQVRYATAHGTPRGYLSDLYPRWFGARELLLHGRDPYSPEMTRDIQAGFYGRPLASETPGNRYQQGFYYPLYVAFLLAPTLQFQFAFVMKMFFWLLLGLTAATVPLWLRVLRWRMWRWSEACVVIFVLGSLPIMQGSKLQQMTLLVVPLLAAAMALLASDRPIPAGILLALATIKPQLVFLLLLWLTIWTAADWRKRYRWAASFVFSMVILLAASEWFLPHWIPRFWQAVRQYHSFTGEMSVVEELLPTPFSRGLELLAFVLTLGVCWKERRQAANSYPFALTLSLVLCVTALLVPSYGPYNQVLLIPGVLILLRQRRALWRGGLASCVLFAIAVGLISWPWISCITLASLSFLLRPETVERGWTIPFWGVLQTPVAVTALMLLLYYRNTFRREVRLSSS